MKCLIIGGLSVEIEKNEQFYLACLKLGESIAEIGASLVICSPFTDSADYWVCKGYIESGIHPNPLVHIYYIDLPHIHDEVNKLQSQFGLRFINKIPSSPPTDISQEALSYSWLLCQLKALEMCQIIVAMGGKSDGAANMLLLLAESKNKPILPLPYFGGASKYALERKYYELSDKLGDNFYNLNDPNKLKEVILNLPCLLNKNSTAVKHSFRFPNIFISYPRSRPHEADFIETLLRRRNIKVFRDDSDFGAGDSIPTAIEEAIYSSNIFLATWCREYACSPWCFDEIELALDRAKKNCMEIWIFNLDGTRIVPKRARDLHIIEIKSRDEIEGKLLKLLDSFN
jgi:hypothetical protein